MSEKTEKANAGDRLAKVMARAGLCSRRQAEEWITAGRVKVNGKPIRTPAFNVTDDDKVVVDDKPLAQRSGTRVWLYHKPTGLVVTEKDPEGRPTIFEALKKNGLPRFVTVGRLDINTEGLLLLTNDGGLKRVLELPATGWLRRYRVRAHGKVTQAQLDKLKKGTTVDGVKYGPIEATLEREQGANVWLQVSLREGKNREVKNVLADIGLQVNRLIRTSYGPFQLGDTPIGAVTTVRAKVLRDQLGTKLAAEAGVDFDSPLPEEGPDGSPVLSNPNLRLRKKTEGQLERAPRPRGRTGAPRPDPDAPEKPRKNAPERKGNFDYKPRAPRPEEEKEKRVVHFTDGREPLEFEPKAKRKKKPDEDDRGGFKRDSGSRRDDRPRRDERPRAAGGGHKGSRTDGDKPRGRGPARAGASDGGRPPRRGEGKPGARPSGPRSGGGPRKGLPRGRPQR